MYNVEITCTPTYFGDKDLAIKEFYGILKNRQHEVVNKIGITLVYLGIKPVDIACALGTYVNNKKEKLYVRASIRGRGLSYNLYDFEYIKEQVEKTLSEEYSFRPGELSVNVYLNEINLLTYRIESLKAWFNYIRYGLTALEP
jgi:hypothetical protein